MGASEYLNRSRRPAEGEKLVSSFLALKLLELDLIMDDLADLHTIVRRHDEIADRDDESFLLVTDEDFTADELASPKTLRTKDDYLRANAVVTAAVLQNLIRRLDESELFESEAFQGSYDDEVERLEDKYWYGESSA